MDELDGHASIDRFVLREQTKPIDPLPRGPSTLVDAVDPCPTGTRSRRWEGLED